MGSLLGLLGIGGGGSGLGAFGGSQAAGGTVGPTTVSVNTGGSSNTLLYVVLGVIAFVALLFFLGQGHRK